MPSTTRPTDVGKPSYFSPKASVDICSASCTSYLFTPSQFSLKNTADFCLFTSCPVPMLYIPSAILSAPRLDAWVKIKQSSAKRRCEIHGECKLTRTLREMYWGPLTLSMHVRPSEQSRNKYGEIGSPWRIPLVGLNDGERAPFTITEKVTNYKHFITRLHQPGGKPNANMMSCIYLHPTRSYAFIISSLIAQDPDFPFLFLK